MRIENFLPNPFFPWKLKWRLSTMAFNCGSGGLQFDAKGIVHNQDNEFEPEYKREIRKYERAQLC